VPLTPDSPTPLPAPIVIAINLSSKIFSIVLSLILPMASVQGRRKLVLSLYSSSQPPHSDIGRYGEAIVIPDHRRAGLIPCSQAYPVEEVMLDLLHLSAISLKMFALLPFSCPLDAIVGEGTSSISSQLPTTSLGTIFPNILVWNWLM
jgi:hypothetical protein